MNPLTVLSLFALAFSAWATSPPVYPNPNYKEPGNFNQNSCANFFRCCPTWAAQGYCNNYQTRNYMRANCKASCGVCYPNYLQGYGCHDYFTGCYNWANYQYMCKNSNKYWMGENCRATCGWCHVARDVDQCPYDRRPNFRPEPVVAASEAAYAPLSSDQPSDDSAGSQPVASTGPVSNKK